MKILKFLLYIILAVVVLIALAGIILPKEYYISSTEEINAPVHMINRNVSDFSQWTRWMPWKDEMPNMKLEMGDPYKGKDASYSWNAGKQEGSMRITAYEPSDSMRTAIDFGGRGTANGIWKFDPEGDKTKVTWGMETEAKFPMNVLFYFQQGSIKGMFSKGLKNLEKTCLEDMANGLEYGDYTVQLERFSGARLVGERKKIQLDEMENFFGTSYGKIYRVLGQNDIEIQSPPMAVYYEWNPEDNYTDCAAVVSLEKDLEVVGLERMELNPSKALSITYTGDYDKLEEVHSKMEAAAADLGVDLMTPAIETYLKGPEATESSEEYVTKVTYLYKS
jgi:effector-binding domain-containing protein